MKRRDWHIVVGGHNTGPAELKNEMASSSVLVSPYSCR